MENGTKKCRECKADIPTDAKVCQFCKSKQWSWFSRHKIITIILIIFLIGILASLWGKWKQINTTKNTQIVEEGEIKKDVTISADEFNKIKSGMTYKDMTEIIGGEGEVISEWEIGNIKTTMYKFNGSWFWSNANITVQNGKVMMKAQFGLK